MNHIKTMNEHEHTNRRENLSKEEGELVFLLHLISVLGFFVGGFGGLVATILFWGIKKDVSRVFDKAGLNAINFQISFLIYVTVLSVFSALTMIILIGFFSAFLLIPVTVAWLVFPIIAAVKSRQGFYYELPFTIKFLK